MKLIKKPKEEVKVMETQEGSRIRELLRMKGGARLCVKNDITLALTRIDPEVAPGVRFKFLETKKRDEDEGSWIEYNLLLEVDKYLDTVDYISYVFKSIGKILGGFKQLDFDSVGIGGIETGLPEFYYVLIYFLSDGKDKTIDKKEENYFESGGGEEGFIDTTGDDGEYVSNSCKELLGMGEH